MKTITLRLLSNQIVKQTSKDPVFIEEGESIKITIDNANDFNALYLMKKGEQIPLDNNEIVIPYAELDTMDNLMILADNTLYTLETLKVHTLKLIGDHLMDKYPEILINILKDIQKIFDIIKDYDTIKVTIEQLKKMVTVLYREVMEKDVIA